MGKVVQVLGKPPERESVIADMEPGDTGYTVPWAYDENTGQLKDSFSISEKGGTASLYVECVKKGEYVIEFEEPEYRSLFGFG